MYTCPHCGEAGISFYKKSRAGSAVPAICIKCSQASCVNGWVSLVSSLLGQVIILGGLILAFWFSNMWLFLLAPPIYIVCEMLAVHFSALTPLSSSKVKRARIGFFAFIVVFILLIFVSGFYLD